MNKTRRLISLTLMLSVMLCLFGCATTGTQGPIEMSSIKANGEGQMLVRTGQLVIEVEFPSETSVETIRIVRAAGGFIKNSHSKNNEVFLECRVPAAALDSTMAAVSRLGAEKKRLITATDVTAEHADLEARLKSKKALRDRLQLLLEKAVDVSDVLEIERELTRVQSDIESMQAQYDLLSEKVVLSTLTITIEKKVKLGPVSYVVKGAYDLVSMLFFLD